MRLLIAMNLPRAWVPFLAASGIEAVHWADIGPIAALDPEIMDYARQHGMTVMTKDLDFGELLALNNSIGPSVIQLRGGDPMPQVSGDLVISAINSFHAQIEQGALVTIRLLHARVRLLPINGAFQ
jgi:predicted nuclease of predicted toxin-antitoxin system